MRTRNALLLLLALLTAPALACVAASNVAVRYVDEMDAPAKVETVAAQAEAVQIVAQALLDADPVYLEMEADIEAALTADASAYTGVAYTIPGIGECVPGDHAVTRHGDDAWLAREVIQRGGPDKHARCDSRDREVLGAYFTGSNGGMFAIIVRGLTTHHELTAFVIKARQVDNYWANVLRVYGGCDLPGGGLPAN